MSHLTWSTEALADVSRLSRFLRPKSPNAARRAVVAIRDGARLLERFPASGRPMENMGIPFRELPIGFGDSGYLLYYRVDGDDVTILAVRHAREAGY